MEGQLGRPISSASPYTRAFQVYLFNYRTLHANGCAFMSSEGGGSSTGLNKISSGNTNLLLTGRDAAGDLKYVFLRLSIFLISRVQF